MCIGIFVINALRTANDVHIYFRARFLQLQFIIYKLFAVIARVHPVIAFAGGVFCFWIKCRKIFRIVWK
jgi:hypothetical protein